MLMVALNETIDRLAMANSVCWYGHVLRRTLDYEVVGHGRNRMPTWIWKKYVVE